MSAPDLEATGLSACNDCALSTGDGCCGGSDHGHGALRSDRAVAASAGAVTVLLASAVLTVEAARAAWVAVPAVLTTLGGVLLLVLGVVALRRSDARGDAAIRRALRVLPAVAGSLVVTLALAVLAVFRAA